MSFLVNNKKKITDEAGRFLFFISQKTDEATFFLLFYLKQMRHLFFVHLKFKNVDTCILILTYE